jgi:competence protein ComFA
MRCLPFWVYRLQGAARRQRYFITCHPALDACYWQQRGSGQVLVLTPPLSIARAEELQHLLQRRLPAADQEAAVIRRQLRRWQLPAPLPAEPVQPLPEWEGQLAAAHLRQLLGGRILMLEEVERAVKERRLWLSHGLTNLLQYLYLEGEVDCRATVGIVPHRRCLRCGSSDLRQETCLECGETEVWVCNSCGEMGAAKSCRPYYAAATTEGPPPGAAMQEVQLRLPFSLTPAQERAAAALQRFIGAGPAGPGVCLFWAVCGAGKTETTLPALAQVLSAGGRVLWATPRRDVVQELAPRLQAALPQVPLAAYHAGTYERFADTPLVIATTHQALRFYAAFDLVILDEADAFPYAHNPMLELAVRRALRPQGKLVYLTATPSEELLREAKRGQVEQVLLPARWHGQPLPEPELHLLRLPRPDQEAWPVPQLLSQLLKDSVERDLCQTLVFVPSVALAESVGKALQQHFEQQGIENWVEYIHASDPGRLQKRTRFFAGEFPILVTTTLMERGITIPRLNIIVLYANWEQIFSEAVLIQIAGRAGRAADYPRGRVCFVAERKSRAMQSARQKIMGLNAIAKQVAATKETH